MLMLGNDTSEKMNVIKFKDAVGRRFSFPFNTVKTWAVSMPFALCGFHMC
jgi:hypothetical protein